MPDVTTTCPAKGCGASFKTSRGLAVHLTRSGHGKAAKSQAIIDALARGAVTARPIPCPFPGCNAKGFRTRHGLKVHQALAGHQAPHDTVAKGDGPQPEPTHPALRAPDGATD